MTALMQDRIVAAIEHHLVMRGHRGAAQWAFANIGRIYPEPIREAHNFKKVEPIYVDFQSTAFSMSIGVTNHCHAPCGKCWHIDYGDGPKIEAAIIAATTMVTK